MGCLFSKFFCIKRQPEPRSFSDQIDDIIKQYEATDPYIKNSDTNLKYD